MGELLNRCVDADVTFLLRFGRGVIEDMRLKQSLSVGVPILVGLLALEQPVHAYLDPGSGSVLLQVLLGGFAAVGVIARLFWHRLTAVFRRSEVDHGRR